MIFFCIDNILDDKPEGKSSADKEEQPVDEIPKRMKKTDFTVQSKGKVGLRFDPTFLYWLICSAFVSVEYNQQCLVSLTPADI